MKKVIKWLLIITVILLIFKILIISFAEPVVKNKIADKLNSKLAADSLEIEKVHINILKNEIEVKGINIRSTDTLAGNRNISVKIASFRIKGLSISKAIFKKEVYIKKAVISNGSISGKLLFPGKSKKAIISPAEITIAEILFDTVDVDLKDLKTSQSVFEEDGLLKLSGFSAGKNDTLSPANIENIEFSSGSIAVVSADSMYSWKMNGIESASISRTLNIDSLFIIPNYGNYDFTSRYSFQTNRFEGEFRNISLSGFAVMDFISSGNLLIDYVVTDKMKLTVFRDKRKEFKHVEKPVFQKMIKSYKQNLDIDSIGIMDGEITYTEHSEKGTEPGSLSFDKMNAKIYNISNTNISDSVKTLILKVSALLMNKGKINILLKGDLNKLNNPFTVNGILKDFDISEINPFIEKIAFINIASGRIDEMKFFFTADDISSKGNMSLIYHGLSLALINSQSGDTTAFRERFISFIINRRVLDSNPLPKKEIRIGIIEFERDPERFLFQYCAKSIMSGVKSSILKTSKN